MSRAAKLLVALALNALAMACVTPRASGSEYVIFKEMDIKSANEGPCH